MKIGKLKTGSRAWLKSLRQALFRCSPELLECGRCGRIIQEGYCCCHCGTGDTGENVIIPEEWIK